MNSSSLKVWFAALVLFFVGTAVGTALTLIFAVRPLHARAAHPVAANPPAERALARIERNLIKDLDLNEAETRDVRAELDRTAKELRRARIAAMQDARGILRESAARIAEKLPPEKRVKFKTLVEQRLHRPDFAPGPTPEK